MNGQNTCWYKCLHPFQRKWPEKCLTQGLEVCKRALIDSTEIISVKLNLLAAAQFNRWALLSTLPKALLSIFLRAKKQAHEQFSKKPDRSYLLGTY